MRVHACRSKTRRASRENRHDRLARRARLFLIALLGTPLFVILGGGALCRVLRAGDLLERGHHRDEPPGHLADPARDPDVHLRRVYLRGEPDAGAARALTSSLFGWIPGSLALVAMVACAIFTAFTGGSGVTIVAMGGLLMPALMREGFSQRYSLGLMTTSGSLGFLFPPSLALILYSYVASQSASGLVLPAGTTPEIDRLFLAGLLPGIFLIVVLSFFAMREGREAGARAGVPIREGLRDLVPALSAAAWEVPLAVPDSRRDLRRQAHRHRGGDRDRALRADRRGRDLPRHPLAEGSRDRGGEHDPRRRDPDDPRGALGLTNFLIDAEVPMRILDWVRGFITSRFMFLLALNVLLLIVGSLMEIFSAMIVVPLIVPIALEYNVNLVHLGIIFMTNLEIGFLTPPFGLNLFISSFRFGRPVTEVYRATLPFLLVLLIALMVITYWPDMSLWLPGLHGAK